MAAAVKASSHCQALGREMLPDLQTAGAKRDLVEFDPSGGVDVRLYWQQWRLRSPALERVARAVRETASTTLR
jgi:LysR family transcriptional regulator, chromosome initiation inhibitor